MNAPKKSIRDFFSPVPSATRAAGGNATLQRVSSDASSAQTSRPTNRAPPREPSDQSSRAAASQVSPLTSSSSAVVASPTTSITIEAQPLNPSQNSAASGTSRRVVSNGEQVVLNSDSESDSLPDLDWGEPKTSYKPAVPSTRLKRASEDENDALRKPDKKGRNNKRSFNKLVQNAHNNMGLEQKIKEHKADLDKTLENPAKANIVINEDTLGQAIQDNDDDPEKAHRLLLAMQRTNTTQMESVFYFFEDMSDSIRVQPKFPYRCLPKHQWASIFADSTARDQAFLTGFAYQIFRLQQLPEELAFWMLDQICFGQSEALSTRYLDILELHHEYIQKNLDKDRLNTLFRAIGGDVKCLRPDIDVVPSSKPQSADKSLLPFSLKPIIKMLHRAATWLDMEAKCHALCILCHICLDERISADANILKIIQDAMDALIHNIADCKINIYEAETPPPPLPESRDILNQQLHNLISALVSRITHPGLQKNLVYAISARSLLSACFQRHLALCFLLYPQEIDVSIIDPKIPHLIHEHLDRSPDFRVGKTTNYGDLAARLTLLDIAIGPGLLSVPYKPIVSPTSSRKNCLPTTTTTTTTSSSSSEIRKFNDEVDALAKHVKILGNSIAEVGAVVDYSIMSAKDRFERLCARLEHAVRIGGKKPQNIFGDNEEKQSRVSQFFLKSKAVSDPAAPSCGIFGGEDSGETDV